MLLIVSILIIPPLSSAKEYIEINRSINSPTLDSVSSIGYYATTTSSRRSTSIIYVGADIVVINDKNLPNNISDFRLKLGSILNTKPVAPYFEIGTGIIDAILLNTSEDEDCQNSNKCNIDVNIRFGFKADLTKEISIGVFYETADYNSFRKNKLSGRHSFSGVSLYFNL